MLEALMKALSNAKRRPQILAIGGTTRRGSTSERALAIAADEARKLGADVVEILGPDLVLPLYDPAKPNTEPQIQRLRDAARTCDGVLISSASYHGGVPGILKNAIDYIDNSDSERPYLTGRAVGSIACAGGWQAGGATLTALRTTVHALRAWPTPLGVVINSSEPVFNPDGSCIDDKLDKQIRTVSHQVIAFSLMNARIEAIPPFLS